MAVDKRANLHLGYDLEKLVPEISGWNHGDGIDVVSWINHIGNFEHGIAYGRMFWPDFIERDDCVFFADLQESSYLSCMHMLTVDKESVERLLNHRHMSDFFPGQNPTDAQVSYFGR